MKSLIIRSVIAVVLLSLVAIFLFNAGNVKVTFEENSITVQSTFVGSTTVPYEEITSIEYVENFDIGRRDFGMGTFKIEAGTYSNDDFGKYKLYSYSKIESFIIVHHNNGILVYNQSTMKATEDAYKLLSKQYNNN